MNAQLQFLLLGCFVHAFDCNNSNLEIGLASQGFTINEETLDAARSACYQVLKLKLEQTPRYPISDDSNDCLDAAGLDTLDEGSATDADVSIGAGSSESEAIWASDFASFDESGSESMPIAMAGSQTDATTTHTLPHSARDRDQIDAEIEDIFDDEADAEAYINADTGEQPITDQDAATLMEAEQPIVDQDAASSMEAEQPSQFEPVLPDVMTDFKLTDNQGFDLNASSLELISVEEARKITLENTAPAPPKSRFEELLELYPELLQYTWPAKNIYKMNVYRPTRVKPESLEGQKRPMSIKLQKNVIKHNIVEKNVFSE